MTTSASPSPAHANYAGPAARAVDLHKVYGSGDTQVAALDGVSVEFRPGQFTAIMGPSGSGKSTLMHCLAALDDATSGQVYVGDADLTTLGDKELTRIRRDRIGFVFQAFNLVPTLTAIENITLPMDIAGRKPDKEWLDTVITTIGLADRLDHKPSQLSGGQQRRVACARALASRPDIVFADEPTGTSTRSRARKCWGSCAGRSANSARPSSWSPTTRTPPGTRTGWCSWPTGTSSTRWPSRPPNGSWTG